jgi:syntaxin 5
MFEASGSGGSEADRLTFSIKADLQRITPALDALQRVIDSRKEEAARVGAVAGGRHLAPQAGGGRGGGPGSACSPLDPVSTVQGLSHSDAVLSGLKGQLLGVAHSLKGVAAARSETLAKNTERRQLFGGGGGARDLGRPLAFSSSPPTAQQQQRDGGDHTAISIGASGSPAGSSAGAGGGGGGAAAPFSMVTQAQLLRDPELAYVSARAQEVAGLESTIAELGSLFGRLASLVAEQGSVVERIDNDLEAATHDMQRGTEQLQKKWDSVSSNSGLAIRVVGVVAAFALFYGIVLV